MPKKVISKEEEHKCVWVRKNTGLEIQVSEVNNLIDPIMNELGVVIAGKYLNDDASFVELELIYKKAQKVRANKIWVYKGTSIPYTEAFDPDHLINLEHKNGLISAGTLDVGGETILLELIPKNTQGKRKEAWVYKDTSIPYKEAFDPNQLTNTKRKNGLISAGTLIIDGKAILLELVSKNTQNTRQKVWVYKDSNIPYTEPFDPDQLTNPERKNGLISAGMLNVDGKAISLELISKNSQNGRQKIWVYKGTSIPYTKPFEPNQLTNHERKNGLISAGTLNVDGEAISLELISKNTQRKRIEVWVYKGTSIPYTESFDLDQLTNPERKNGLISTGTLNIDGEAILIELVSKSVQIQRQEIWVYKDTNIAYAEPFNLQQLTNTKRRNGLISEGTLNIGGEIIFLELISRNAQKERQEVLVYKGTSIPYTELFNPEQLANTEHKKNGLISTGTLNIDGETISLEFITKTAQRQRSEVWVYKGTSIPYAEPFDLQQLTNMKRKNGLISEGTLNIGGEAISLELISKNAQIKRTEVWVYKGTNIIYSEPFNLTQLKNPEIKNGFISAGTLEVDGEIIQLEFITRTKKTHSKNSSAAQEAQTESIHNNEEFMDIDSMITPELMNLINQMDSEQSINPALPIDEEDLARPTLKRKSDAIDPNPSKKTSTFFRSHKRVPDDVVVQKNPSNKLSS